MLSTNGLQYGIFSLFSRLNHLSYNLILKHKLNNMHETKALIGCVFLLRINLRKINLNFLNCLKI